jgi:hypothetical protein
MEALCGVFGGGRVPIVQAAGSSFLLGLRRFGATTEPRHAALTSSSPRGALDTEESHTLRLSVPISKVAIVWKCLEDLDPTGKTQFSHSEHSAHLKRLRENAAPPRALLQYKYTGALRSVYFSATSSTGGAAPIVQ